MTFPKSNYVKHLESEVEWLRNELGVAKGKIDRLELAVMQQTPAGANYVRRSAPPTPPAEMVGVSTRPGSWQSILAKHCAELDKEIENDKIRGKKETQ